MAHGSSIRAAAHSIASKGGDVRPSDLPHEALPHAFRGWYGACRAWVRSHPDQRFLAQFGNAEFRAGFSIYPNGLHASGMEPCRAELCRYLDDLARRPKEYGKVYRRIHIRSQRRWRLEDAEAA